MKLNFLLLDRFALCVLLLTGCRTQPPHAAIKQGVDEIKKTALAYIAAKYPDANMSELKFAAMQIRILNNKQLITVGYDIPSTEETTTKDGITSTSEAQYDVTMLLTGELFSIEKGSNWTRSINSQFGFTNSPPK